MTGDDGSEEGPMEAPGRGAVFTAYPNAVHFGDVPAGCVYRYKVCLKQDRGQKWAVYTVIRCVYRYKVTSTYIKTRWLKQCGDETSRDK